MANALFGKWEEDACDLNAASNIDCDDEINTVIKKVGYCYIDCILHVCYTMHMLM
jgi:hypothetical protein